MPERDEVPLRTDWDPAAEEPQAPVPTVTPVPDEEPTEFVPARVGGRTELGGWAGAPPHGGVRPRARAPGRSRPSARWRRAEKAERRPATTAGSRKMAHPAG